MSSHPTSNPEFGGAAPASAHPDPGHIWQLLNAYQSTYAMAGAVELDLFTQLAERPMQAAELASRVHANERGVRNLCNYLVVLGLLSKHEESFELMPESAAFLSKKSPMYMGSTTFFMTHPMQVANFARMADAVRTGGSPTRDAMEPENELWVEFARSMGPVSAMGASAVAEKITEMGRPIKVLDIAAGPGFYGISVAKRNPAAEIYAVDWRNVLKVSIENAEKAGIADRYHAIAGSAFDTNFGSNYDLILLPNFLHHFDRANNIKLLKKVKAALIPGGRVATVEFVPNDDRVSPPAAAAFSLTMLVNTAGGDVYTFREYESMFREAGFGDSTGISLAPSPETLIVTNG